jgi:hypothetical protein
MTINHQGGGRTEAFSEAHEELRPQARFDSKKLQRRSSSTEFRSPGYAYGPCLMFRTPRRTSAYWETKSIQSP